MITLNLSLYSDFDYDYLGATIINSLNINVRGDFIKDDANNDFTWSENYNLNVSGNASFIVDSFSNRGSITADTFTLSVPGDFDYINDFC